MQGTAAPGLPLGRAGRHWACSRRNEPVIQSVVLPARSVSKRVWAVAGMVARNRVSGIMWRMGLPEKGGYGCSLRRLRMFSISCSRCI